MKITIEFETQTIPDFTRGQTYSETRKLKISFDGEKLASITEFMDADDEKEAIECIRSSLRLYERKKGLSRTGTIKQEDAIEYGNSHPIKDTLLDENERLREALVVVKKAEKEFLRAKYMGTPIEKIINDAIRQEDFNTTISGVLETNRKRLMEALELIKKTGKEKPFDGNACAYIAELALSGKRPTYEWEKIEKEINGG